MRPRVEASAGILGSSNCANPSAASGTIARGSKNSLVAASVRNNSTQTKSCGRISRNHPETGLSGTRDIPVGIMPQCVKKRPMSNPSMLDQDRPVDPKSPTTNEPDESFGDILSEYEQSHTHRIREEGKRGLEGTVVAITGESVFLDIGYKTEGTIPLAEFQAAGES